MPFMPYILLLIIIVNPVITNNFVISFKCGMQIVFSSDLNRAVDIIYGLLHQDVVGCTLSLLVHTLPMYLTGPNTGELMGIF